MGSVTTRLYAVQSSYTANLFPSKNYYDQNILRYGHAAYTGGSQMLYTAFFSYEQPAFVMRRKPVQILSSVYIYVTNERDVYSEIIDSPFDDKTLNFLNAPTFSAVSTVGQRVFGANENLSWKTGVIKFYNDKPETDDEESEPRDITAQFVKLLKNGQCFSNPTCYGNIYGARSDYRPYLDVTTVEAEITIANPYPAQNAFVNKREPIKFSWEIGYDKLHIPGILNQKSALFRWRPKGSTSYTEIPIAGSATQYTMPANTVSSSQIEWQVVATSEDDVVSPPSPWITLTTVDSIPVSNPISPVNAYIEMDQPNIFTWSHVIDTGSLATKSELQYSVDKAAWNALATITGAALSTTIPAGTLPIDRIWWRVRTYNTDNVASSWSSPAAVVVRGRPRPPSISSISNESRPVIRWQSASQAAYQLQILDSSGAVLADTKEIHGTDKVYSLNDYLPSGAYSMRLRIKASNGLWSDWAQSGFIISASSSVVPQVRYTPVDGGVQIQVTNAGSFAKLYLLRNGKPIAQIVSAYTDYTAEKSQYYTVRGVNTSDNFTDSIPELVQSEIPQGARLAAVSDLSNMIPLYLRRNEPVAQETGIEHMGTAVYYAGREHPVYHYSEHSEQSANMEFAVKEWAQYQNVLDLLRRRETILYRDLYGEKFYCVIPTVSDTRDHRGVSFTLSMQRVDYKETISYKKKVVT